VKIKLIFKLTKFITLYNGHSTAQFNVFVLFCTIQRLPVNHRTMTAEILLLECLSLFIYFTTLF